MVLCLVTHIGIYNVILWQNCTFCVITCSDRSKNSLLESVKHKIKSKLCVRQSRLLGRRHKPCTCSRVCREQRVTGREMPRVVRHQNTQICQPPANINVAI